MLDIESFKKFILSAVPTAKLASGGTVINCRCFECPDSSDPRTGHFYFLLPKSETDVIRYYCHKCNCSGIVSYNKLIDWGIYDDSIGSMLLEHNKNYSKSTSPKYSSKRIVYSVNNNLISNNEISLYKLNYINNRLGTNFSFEDLKQLKIVLNLTDILTSNNINEITREKFIVELLSNNFLGFLSIDNSFLNMRRLCDEGILPSSIDKRYINYKLFNSSKTAERFYTIPTVIDLTEPYPINIHIAEGPFDILSIYENIRHRERGIYTSVSGSNYLGIIKYFLINFKLPYVVIHLYPDNDKSGSNEKMNEINVFLKTLGIDSYIHRNLYPNEKDFGIHISHIKEGIIKM